MRASWSSCARRRRARRRCNGSPIAMRCGSPPRRCSSAPSPGTGVEIRVARWPCWWLRLPARSFLRRRSRSSVASIARPEVQRVDPVGAWTERELLRLAGAVEHAASHLLARTFVTAAERMLARDGTRLPTATAVVEVAGRGVSGRVDGHEVTVGAWSFVRERYPSALPLLIELDRQYDDTPGLRAYIAIDGEVAGVVEYADRIRDDAPEVVAELAALGLHRQVLLSGDHATNVAAIAREAGLAESHGDFHPGDKERFISDAVEGGDVVLMVGDGIN